MTCKFCQIVSGELPAELVFEDHSTLAFLDHRALLPGHTLLVPRAHHETLVDVPEALLVPLFGNAKLLARAVEEGLGAEGSLIAINNRVSQSVPHLHVHVIPRSRKDGLKGFFWPRQGYADQAEMERVRDALRAAAERLHRLTGAR